jgi:hypothetical protein
MQKYPLTKRLIQNIYWVRLPYYLTYLRGIVIAVAQFQEESL